MILKSRTIPFWTGMIRCHRLHLKVVPLTKVTLGRDTNVHQLRKLLRTISNEALWGIILAIDCTHVADKDKLSLESVLFSLSIIHRALQNHPFAWRQTFPPLNYWVSMLLPITKCLAAYYMSTNMLVNNMLPQRLWTFSIYACHWCLLDKTLLASSCICRHQERCPFWECHCHRSQS
jgi:hypothetical protein